MVEIRITACQNKVPASREQVSCAVILWASLTVKLSKGNWPLAALATGQYEADQ